MKQKRRSLFSPLALFFLLLALAVIVYGVVRYFVAVQAWSFDRDALFRVLWEVLPAIVVLAAVGLFALIYCAARILKPVKKLRLRASETAKRIADREEAPVAFGAGCIGALSETLEKEEGKLAQLFVKTAHETDAEATERERLAAALRILTEVSPEKRTLESLTYGVQIDIARAAEVGADFCDCFAPDKRRVFLAVGDVWERGLPAALFVAGLLRELREKLVAGSTPAEALSALNASALTREDGMAATLFCAVFDSISGELRYANAGHLPPVIAGERSGFLRMRAGVPIGLFADAQFTDELCRLLPGQGLIVYTDGVVNAHNGTEYFGYERLLSAVGEHYGSGLTADTAADGVMDAVNEFGNSGDDRAVLALYFPAGVQRLLAPQLSELNKMRELLEHWLQNDPRRKNIELACEEIFTNIVNHGGAKSIQIACEREESSFVIRFTDDGEPFDPLHVEGGEKDLYSLAEGGMGVTIIRRIAGEIFYRTKQNMNVLTVRFPVIKGI